MRILYSTDADLFQFVGLFLLASLFFKCPISWSSFFLAVQDERGPRKSKLPKITEINTVEPENWKTRSKMFKLMIPLLLHQLHNQRVIKNSYLYENVIDFLPISLKSNNWLSV